MFSLTPGDLSGNILDCAAGPASFNAEATRQGSKVVSCDPIYRFGTEEIRARIHATFETLVANASARREEFVWRDIESPRQLGEVRMAAMQLFLEDFPQGLEQGRYTTDGLPNLRFEDGKFDLALCSHFLFTYSDQLSTGFHVAAIEEMCRVAHEVRVFPLLKSYGGPSPHLDPVMDALGARDYRVEIRQVPYEFQRGGNEMLSVPG
ncbi:MAG: SAM-dependent methyltransferase [Rubrobacter sp.]|nr:SAM-dependent methyltransferase [Rubrobacter sp.]